MEAAPIVIPISTRIRLIIFLHNNGKYRESQFCCLSQRVEPAMSLSQTSSGRARDGAFGHDEASTRECVTLLPRHWTEDTHHSDSGDQLLPRKPVLFYGVGHMLNDLTSACWFTYLLIFLTDIGLSSSEAAMVMLSGQLADGVATIFVGSLIDKHGHYKLWHFGGCALVAVSFSSVFGGCWACTILGTDSRVVTTFVYSVFAAIFNIGWAATQVSHMSLVNCLSSNPTSRVALTSCRNAFTMIANLCLYAIAYVIFKAFPAKDPFDVERQFRWIALISVVSGWCFTLIFLVGVKEPRLEHLLRPLDFERVSWVSWFRKALYYQVAFVYVATRLATNVSQAFLAFFLIDDLNMRDSAKAVVPATMYVSSFLVSVGLQELGSWTGNRIKFYFSVGSTLWMISGALIYLLSVSTRNYVFILSAIIGVANALMTVTAVSMEGILVGLDLSGCAFVYASLSFLDKFSCGVALYVIEALNNADGKDCKPEALGRAPCHTSTVRMTLALVPAGCALLGVCVTLLMDLRTHLSIAELEEPLLSREEHSPKDSLYSWKMMKPDVRETRGWKILRRLLGRWCCRRGTVVNWLY